MSLPAFEISSTADEVVVIKLWSVGGWTGLNDEKVLVSLSWLRLSFNFFSLSDKLELVQNLLLHLSHRRRETLCNKIKEQTF